MGSTAARAAAERKTYNHPCTIARALDVLGDRWTLLILRDLMAGLYRYSDILENCGGMSPNVLSDRLKRLEGEGLVERKYYKELPPRVEYSLTQKGWDVRPILVTLIDWGNEYLEPLATELVGTDVPQDFAMRTVPAFTFNPDRAEGIAATMVVEIQDCTDCNTWSFEITGGQIRPRRNGVEDADIRLKATTEGFFRFIHGTSAPAECGELEGSHEIAVRIQACFTTS